MPETLSVIAPQFVEMAHNIGVAVAASVDRHGRPHTRVMQPVWTFDGESLSGVVSTVTTSPKVAHLRRAPNLSLTYWAPNQNTCSAECDVVFVTDDADRAAAWNLFLTTPPPAGFDPAHYPDWTSSASPTFGVFRLSPTWLRVMPGTLMTSGEGSVSTWRRR